MRNLTIMLFCVLVLASCTANQADLLRGDAPPPQSMADGPSTLWFHSARGDVQDTVGYSPAGDFEYQPLTAGLAIIHRYDFYRYEIHGHTDNQECVGTQCIELSRQRAYSVYNWYLDRGVDPMKFVQVVGYGSTRPIDFDTTEEQRARNRRVEFIVILDLDKL